MGFWQTMKEKFQGGKVVPGRTVVTAEQLGTGIAPGALQNADFLFQDFQAAGFTAQLSSEQLFRLCLELLAFESVCHTLSLVRTYGQRGYKASAFLAHEVMSAFAAKMGLDNVPGFTEAFLQSNWLQVSVSTKLPEIDEREGNKFAPQMTTLFGLKAQQQALEFILPGKGAVHAEAQLVERDSEEAFASPFGLLAVPGILLAVGLQPGSEDTLALGFAVTARLQIEHGPGQSEPRFAGTAFAGVQSRGPQHPVPLLDRRHRQGRQDVAVVVH